jgi:hypothetical protein
VNYLTSIPKNQKKNLLIFLSIAAKKKTRNVAAELCQADAVSVAEWQGSCESFQANEMSANLFNLNLSF